MTGCYLVVNVAYLTILSPEEIISSSAVAMVLYEFYLIIFIKIDLLQYVLNIKDVGNALLGPVAFIIPLAVAMSTFGMVLAGFFQNARFIIN